MDIICSTDMGICYLAAEASADFVKVEKKSPPKETTKNLIPYLSLLLLLFNAGEFLINLTIFILQCACSRSNTTLIEWLIDKMTLFFFD